MSEVIIRGRVGVRERPNTKRRIVRTLSSFFESADTSEAPHSAIVSAPQPTDLVGDETMQAIIARSPLCPDKLPRVFTDGKFQVFVFLKTVGRLACDETCSHEAAPSDPTSVNAAAYLSPAEVSLDPRTTLIAEQPISDVQGVQNPLQTS